MSIESRSRIFILLSVFLLISTLYGAQSSKIRIAYNRNNPPYKFLNETGEPTGILVDIWQLWARSTGNQVEFIDAPFVETVQMVRDGRADVHAGLFQSAEREAYFDFTDPIYSVSYYIMCDKKLIGINNPEDLKGFIVGVPEGGFTDSYMQKHYPFLTLKRYKDYPELFAAAESGEIRVFVAPIENLNHYTGGITSDINIRFNPENPLFSQTYRGAIRKGNESLLRQLNEGLTKIPAHRISKLEEKWLGISRQHPSDEVLVISMNMNNEPFSLIDPYGKPTGLFVDFWNEWSSATGKKITFMSLGDNEAIQAVMDGTADIHIGVQQTDWIEKSLLLSEPFYRLNGSLFHLSQTDLPNDLTKLENITLGVIGGTDFDEHATLKLPASSIIKRFASIDDMVFSLISGEIDVLFANPQTGKLCLLQERLSGQVTIEDPVFETTIHAGVNPDNQKLLTQINQGIGNISRQTLGKIEQRWITDPGWSHWKMEGMPIDEQDYTSFLTDAEKEWIQYHPYDSRRSRPRLSALRVYR